LRAEWERERGAYSVREVKEIVRQKSDRKFRSYDPFDDVRENLPVTDISDNSPEKKNKNPK